jgi:hypothetical protein
MKTNRQKFNEKYHLAEEAHLDLEQLAQLSNIPMGCLRQVLIRGSSKSGSNKVDPFSEKKKIRVKKTTDLPLPKVGVGVGFSRVYSFLMKTPSVYGGSEADLVLLFGLPPLEKSDDETRLESSEVLMEPLPVAFRRHPWYTSEDRDQSSSPHEEEPIQYSESERAEHIELMPSDDPQPFLRTHNTIQQYLEQIQQETQHLEPGSQFVEPQQICSATPQSKNQRRKKV